MTAIGNHTVMPEVCGRIVSRAARVSAVPIVAAAFFHTVTMMTMLVFGTNTGQPRSFTVTNGIA